MAKRSSPSNTKSPGFQRRQRGARKSSIEGFLSADVRRAVRDAAGDDDTWQKALRNPAQFFDTQGINIPDGVFVRFLEAPSEGPSPAGVAGALHWSGGYPTLCPPCPPGLVPTIVREVQPVCTKLVEVWTDCWRHPLTGEWFCGTQRLICLEWEIITAERCYCGLRNIGRAPPDIEIPRM